MILSLMLASVINIFVVESPSYSKEMVAAARELTARHPELHFTIRTTEQIVEMKPDELKQAIERSSIVHLGRVYGDVASKIQDAFPTGSSPKIVFAAHSDFGVYALSRFGSTHPFAAITPEQVQQISSGTLDPASIPALRRWSRPFNYLLAKGP